jgi:hypothetical protein
MMRRVVPLAITGAMVLLGCAGGDGAPATAPVVDFAAPASTDGTPPEQLAMPLTSLLWASQSDFALINLAANQVTAGCMAERGFEFPRLGNDDLAFVLPLRPFGPWTEADIADGYGASVGPTQRTALDEFRDGLPPDVAGSWAAAYSGNDPFGGAHPTVRLPDGSEVESGFAEGYQGSCSFEGLDAVFGDYVYREELRQEIEELVNEASSEAEDGSDLVDQALEVWRECIEAQGLDVPDEPNDLAVRYISEPGVSEEERTVALSDVRCKEEANLHDAYFVARAEIEERLIDEHQVFVEAWRELVNDSLARAREILGDAGG